MNKLLGEELKVVNVGLKGFMESLVEQKAEVIHVNWKPSQKDKETEKILSDLL